MSKDLSLVIVTYNSHRLIFDCLESVFLHNDLADGLEVIVVDNCSADQEEVFSGIRKTYNDRVTLLASPKNGGYGYGNNRGIELAQAPVVVVMNPDVRLVKPVFKSILKNFHLSNTALVGVRFVDGSNTFYYKPEYVGLCNTLLQKVFFQLRLFKADEVYFSGSFLAFSKSDFLRAGCFDENIFLYFEEPDITNRIRALGKAAVLDETIEVLHLAHGREVNLRVIDEHLKTLHYYHAKYPFALRDYFKAMIKVMIIKKYAAVFLRNEHKRREFDAWNLKYQEALKNL